MGCCRLLLLASVCLALASCSPTPDDDFFRSRFASRSASGRRHASVGRDALRVGGVSARAGRGRVSARAGSASAGRTFARAGSGSTSAGKTSDRVWPVLTRTGFVSSATGTGASAFSGTGSSSASAGSGSASASAGSGSASASTGSGSASASAGSGSASASAGSASASAGGSDDYDYDYDYDYDDFPPPPPALSFSIFDDTSAKFTDEAEAPATTLSPCTWGVVNCCSNADVRGSRILCFEQQGCPGTWFEDLCTPEVKKGVFQKVFGTIQG